MAKTALMAVVAPAPWRAAGHASAPGGRYSFAGTGTGALGTFVASWLFSVFTCGLAGLFGVPQALFRRWRIHNATRDGMGLAYDSQLGEAIGHAILNVLLYVFTCGLALPWIVARNERFEVEHTRTAEGHAQRFDGSGAEILVLALVAQFVLLFTLGLAWPVVAVVYLRWKREHTIVLDPRAPGGSYRLRFDAGPLAFMVPGTLSLLLCIVTLGWYYPWASADFHRFAWSATSDTLSPPVAVPAGPRTPAQWALAGGAGLGVAAVMGACLFFAVALRGASSEGASHVHGSPAISSSTPEWRAPRPSPVPAPPWQPPPAPSPSGGSFGGGSFGAPSTPAGPSVALPPLCAGTLTPAGVSASRELREGRSSYTAGQAFDCSYDRAWAVRDPVPGGEWLEARFDEPVRIDRIWLTTGYEKQHRRSGDLFVANAHVRRLSILADGVLHATRDVAQHQRAIEITEPSRPVRRLRLRFDQAWPGTRWQDLSISEVQLHGTRVAGLDPAGATIAGAWCTCFREVTPEGFQREATACRSTEAQCLRLERAARGSGTRLIAPGSLVAPCRAVSGPPPTILGGPGWRESDRAGAWAVDGRCALTR